MNEIQTTQTDRLKQLHGEIIGGCGCCWTRTLKRGAFCGLLKGGGSK
jgi:hypothetical protein